LRAQDCGLDDNVAIGSRLFDLDETQKTASRQPIRKSS
jgi:hypothetical protein